MIPKWQTGIVIKIEQASPHTRRFWIELPETTSFDFKPGQFVTLDLPIHEQRNKRWRSYSIASMPDGTNVIELLIVYLEGGLATTYLFNEVKVGSQLTLRGPQGVFVLPDQLDRDLYLICTGTGIAPFRSMLQYIHKQQIPHKKIHLIYGTRKSDNIFYMDEMKTLEKTLSGFSYHVTLSREDWEGHKGYVHPVYESLIQQDHKPAARFLLCGWRVMIDEAKQRLTSLGYTSKDIEVELYG